MGQKNKDVDKIVEMISAYSKAIDNGDKSYFNYLLRSLSYKKLGRFEKALDDIEMISNEKVDEYHYYKGLILSDSGRFDEAIKEFYEILKLDSERDLDAVECIISTYIEWGKYDEAYNFHTNFDYAKLDSGSVEYLGVDELFTEYYEKLSKHYISLGNFEKAKKIFTTLNEFDRFRIHIHGYIDENIERIDRLRSKSDIENTKVKERDRILSNLSHSIKNLISTVIDPLTNMHEEKEYKDIVIENALKGADLIREIVNAMNLSYKGTIKDFEYDARCNKKDCITLESILIESLKHSVSNMFDSKYFGNFMRNYFPYKEVFQKAKTAWAGADSSNSIIEFINEFMFKCNLNISDASKLYIGNEKGSAIKFQILFQEMILNAVKYVSFVDRQERSVVIDFNVNKNKIIYRIKNNYMKEEKTRTTGLGNVIIDNFAKLLKAEKTISKNGNYVITIKFKNLWKDSERNRE